MKSENLNMMYIRNKRSSPHIQIRWAFKEYFVQSYYNQQCMSNII